MNFKFNNKINNKAWKIIIKNLINFPIIKKTYILNNHHSLFTIIIPYKLISTKLIITYLKI
jgi:hypothetical protein